MNRTFTCKKIACFQCGKLNGQDAQFCSACRFDIASELCERRTSCMYLRLFAIAFALGTFAPLLILFIIGEFGSRELPALGVGAVAIVFAGCAWLWAQRLDPQFVIEPMADDLLALHSSSDTASPDPVSSSEPRRK